MTGYFSCGGQAAEDIPEGDGRNKGRSGIHAPNKHKRCLTMEKHNIRRYIYEARIQKSSTGIGSNFV